MWALRNQPKIAHLALAVVGACVLVVVGCLQSKLHTILAILEAVNVLLRQKQQQL